MGQSLVVTAIETLLDLFTCVAMASAAPPGSMLGYKLRSHLGAKLSCWVTIVHISVV